MERWSKTWQHKHFILQGQKLNNNMAPNLWVSALHANNWMFKNPKHHDDLSFITY